MIKRVGKQTRINIEANRVLKDLFTDKEITRCELCQSPFILSWHHRHKRMFYRSCPELLSDFNQVILVCAKDHDELERDKEYSKEVFMRLRGIEV